MPRKKPLKPPRRWRWASKKKTRREFWRGSELLASVENEGGDGPMWTWRVVGSDRWGMSDDLERCEWVAAVESERVKRN